MKFFKYLFQLKTKIPLRCLHDEESIKKCEVNVARAASGHHTTCNNHSMRCELKSELWIFYDASFAQANPNHMKCKAVLEVFQLC